MADPDDPRYFYGIPKLPESDTARFWVRHTVYDDHGYVVGVTEHNVPRNTVRFTVRFTDGRTDG